MDKDYNNKRKQAIDLGTIEIIARHLDWSPEETVILAQVGINVIN